MPDRISYKEEKIMCKKETHPAVEVKVDVTKIVKYVCIAGVCIVAIIFGVNCMKKLLLDRK